MGVMWLLMVILFLAFCLIILRFSRPNASKINSFEICVSFIQLIAIFASFPIEWNKTVIHHTPTHDELVCSHMNAGGMIESINV
jgi:amino acid permease